METQGSAVEHPCGLAAPETRLWAEELRKPRPPASPLPFGEKPKTSKKVNSVIAEMKLYIFLSALFFRCCFEAATLRGLLSSEMLFFLFTDRFLFIQFLYSAQGR